MIKIHEMAEDDQRWCDMVLYFVRDKDDPTRFSEWDPERCQRLMPALYKAWTDKVLAEDILDRVMESYR